MTGHFGPDDVLIRTQTTPNPYALKFIANHAFKADGKATFSSVAECESIALARDLLNIAGVKQIHFYQNTLTVTFDGQLTPEQLQERVEVVVRTRLPVHDPHFSADSDKKAPVERDQSQWPPERRQIEEILDRTIRPGLRADGGDVEVISFENNEVRILYQGACGGCPSSMMGTLDAIQGILQNETGNTELRVRPL
jgi:Fe-S cluster biogenesis protein NfuA